MALRQIVLAPGKHAIYGSTTMHIQHGEMIIRGAVMREGSSTAVTFPFRGAPADIYTEEGVTIEFEESVVDMILEIEDVQSCPDQLPDYEQIFPNLFYAAGQKGIFYPAAFIERLDEIAAGPPTRMVFMGDVGSGKSTCVRFAVNSLISRHGHAYLVDLDPGQSEMSVPELLTVTKVTEYILSPPEYRTNVKNQEAFHVCGVSIGPVYYQGLLKVLDAIPPNEFVVINTNGWVTKQGLTMQKDIVRCMSVSHVFVMKCNAGLCPSICDHQIVVEPVRVPIVGSIVAKRRRQLRLFGYFLYKQLPVVAQQPRLLHLSEVRICFPDVFVDLSSVLEMLSGRIVYLCRDDRRFPRIRQRVTLLKSVPALPCICCAVVKAVDAAHDSLYITTPGSIEGVNTIVVSVAQTPKKFLDGNPRCRTTYRAFHVR